MQVSIQLFLLVISSSLPTAAANWRKHKTSTTTSSTVDPNGLSFALNGQGKTPTPQPTPPYSKSDKNKPSSSGDYLDYTTYAPTPAPLPVNDVNDYVDNCIFDLMTFGLGRLQERVADDMPWEWPYTWNGTAYKTELHPVQGLKFPFGEACMPDANEVALEVISLLVDDEVTQYIAQVYYTQELTCWDMIWNIITLHTLYYPDEDCMVKETQNNCNLPYADALEAQNKTGYEQGYEFCYMEGYEDAYNGDPKSLPATKKTGDTYRKSGYNNGCVHGYYDGYGDGHVDLLKDATSTTTTTTTTSATASSATAYADMSTTATASTTSYR